MLGLSRFFDLFSMQIRLTMSAPITPERLRGRVGAVEMVFISASNELGAFESGLAASLVGSVPAVVGGGVLTIIIAIGWRWAFPARPHVDRLRDLAPEPKNHLNPKSLSPQLRRTKSATAVRRGRDCCLGVERPPRAGAARRGWARSGRRLVQSADRLDPERSLRCRLPDMFIVLRQLLSTVRSAEERT
jgi:hypothetical protein